MNSKSSPTFLKGPVLPAFSEKKQKQREITSPAKCICGHFPLKFSCWRSNSVQGLQTSSHLGCERGMFNSPPPHNNLKRTKIVIFYALFPNYLLRIYTRQQRFPGSWWCGKPSFSMYAISHPGGQFKTSALDKAEMLGTGLRCPPPPWEQG